MTDFLRETVSGSYPDHENYSDFLLRSNMIELKRTHFPGAIAEWFERPIRTPITERSIFDDSENSKINFSNTNQYFAI